MGRKNKKIKKANAKGAPPNVQSASEHLRAGRFRQAVDGFKVLYAGDPETHREPLLAAYDGLYRQRLSKGMVDEAAMVLVQLEKLGGGDNLETIRLCLKRRDFTKAAALAVKALQAGAPLQDNQAHLVADALVAAFDDRPPAGTLPDGIDRDLESIHKALAAVTEERFDAALTGIKPVAIQSIFNGWKWLLKGLCAFYGQADVKAEAAFARIPVATVPAAVAAPYRALIGRCAGRAPTAQVPDALKAECEVAGYADSAAVLARAEYLWRVGRHRDSHAHIIACMEGFPSDGAGLARSLTQFYYMAGLEMAEEPAYKYFKHLTGPAMTGKADAVQRLWARRALALMLERYADEEMGIVESWQEFLETHTARHGPHPRVRATVFKRLGDICSAEVDDDTLGMFSFFHRGRRQAANMRNARLARFCYEKSLAATPDARETLLALVVFHEKCGDSAEVNRLLDRMIKQFPGDKEVLFKAGKRCLDRSALIKGLKYLEQAMVLDPMDQQVRETFIIVCIAAARNYTAKGDAAKARGLLPRALDAADNHSDCFNLGRANLLLRWSLFERLCADDPDNADALWQQALQERQGSATRLHFLHWLLAGHYGLPRPWCKICRERTLQELQAPVRVDIAVDLIAVLLYARQLSEWRTPPPAQIEPVEAYIAQAAAMPMTREQTIAFMEYGCCNDCRDKRIAEQCIASALARDPDDALFRFFHYLHHGQTAAALGHAHELRSELEKILELAQAQKQYDVVAAARKHLESLQRLRELGRVMGLDDMDGDAHGENDECDGTKEEACGSVADQEILDMPGHAGSAGRRPRPAGRNHSRGNPRKKKLRPPDGPQQLELF